MIDIGVPVSSFCIVRNWGIEPSMVYAKKYRSEYGWALKVWREERDDYSMHNIATAEYFKNVKLTAIYFLGRKA